MIINYFYKCELGYYQRDSVNKTYDRCYAGVVPKFTLYCNLPCIKIIFYIYKKEGTILCKRISFSPSS